MKGKIIKIENNTALLLNRYIDIGDFVVEMLVDGTYDIFEIHTLNDIDNNTQQTVVIDPEINYNGFKELIIKDETDVEVEECYIHDDTVPYPKVKSKVYKIIKIL